MVACDGRVRLRLRLVYRPGCERRRDWQLLVLVVVVAAAVAVVALTRNCTVSSLLEEVIDVKDSRRTEVDCAAVACEENRN